MGPFFADRSGLFSGGESFEDCASAFTHEFGSLCRAQVADHSETMNRWAGRLHDAFGSNMWSWSTKSWA